MLCRVRDRFIVGSIPVGVQATERGRGPEQHYSEPIAAQLSTSGNQPNYGLMRAFIEGDFAGDDDAFRLRHAFGQWRSHARREDLDDLYGPRVHPPRKLILRV